MNFYYTIPKNSDTGQWMPGCASSDFKNIAMINQISGQKGMYLSNDYGSTWYDASKNLTNNGSGTDYWRSICCSSNFSNLTAVKLNGNIWTSSDYGIIWNKNALSAKAWYSVCGSIDLSKQAAVVNSGNIWISTNSGSTWSDVSAAGNRLWTSICCNTDFTKLAAVVNGGNIYTSNNSGSTWTDRASAGTRSWRSIACSSDGGNLIATVENTTSGNVAISRDSGVTWSNITLPANASKSSNPVACSADFKNIIVGSNQQTNFIYSTDYGVTWTTDTNGLINWNSCIVKNNNFIIARSATSNIYVGNFGNYDTTSYTINGASEQSLIRYYPVSDLSSGTLIDRPLSYTNAFYRFDLSSGTDGNFTTQTSTGLDVNTTMSALTPSVFKNFAGTFPVSGAPSQVVDISNNLSGTQTNLVSSVSMTSFSNISVSLWIRSRVVLTAGKRFSIINISPSSTTSVFDVLINGDTQQIQLNLNNTFTGSFATSTTTLVVGTWYHLICTYNSQTGVGNIYINGVLESTVNYGVILNSYNVLLIGMRYGFSNTGTYVGYAGTLTYFNLFHREITQSEVNFLYNYPGQPFTNINTNSLSQLYGGGFPFLRGQAVFGDSDYSKAIVNKFNSSVIYPNFAPFYTCYGIGGPYTHTLQRWTNRVFILAIGGGGGGGGGNYQNGGQSGGGGGGGGGGGMGYTYYSVTSNDIISVTVGAGGDGGQCNVNLGSYYYIGGNGLNGNNSIVTINTVEVCKAIGGSRSKHIYNDNTDTSIYWSGINATKNAYGGILGAGNSYTVISNTGISGGIIGLNGTNGESDPGNLTRRTNPGIGGNSGMGNGLLINGLDFILNSTTINLLNLNNTIFCNGNTIRTFGKGGDGGYGEGGNTNNNQTPGSAGNDGAVIIFEYCV